jgi:hypothetical protein
MAVVAPEPLAEVAETQHELTAGQARAIAEYAKANQFQSENETMEQVQQTTEGVTFWACMFQLVAPLGNLSRGPCRTRLLS